MFILRTLYTNLEFFIVLINFCFKQSKQLPIGQTHDLIDSCSKSKVRKNQRIIGINGKLRQDGGIGIEALSNPTEGEIGPALRPRERAEGSAAVPRIAGGDLEYGTPAARDPALKSLSPGVRFSSFIECWIRWGDASGCWGTAKNT